MMAWGVPCRVRLESLRGFNDQVKQYSLALGQVTRPRSINHGILLGVEAQPALRTSATPRGGELEYKLLLCQIPINNLGRVYTGAV